MTVYKIKTETFLVFAMCDVLWIVSRPQNVDGASFEPYESRIFSLLLQIQMPECNENYGVQTGVSWITNK